MVSSRSGGGGGRKTRAVLSFLHLESSPDAGIVNLHLTQVSLPGIVVVMVLARVVPAPVGLDQTRARVVVGLA